MIPIPAFLTGPLIWCLGIALALSLGANSVLTWAYLGQRDDKVAAAKDRDQARADATACSKGVEEMVDKREKRFAAAAPARAAAQVKAETLTKQADQVLATPATVQGDECKSAADRVDAWWAARGKTP
jgi:hypothetical protein